MSEKNVLPEKVTSQVDSPTHYNVGNIETIDYLESLGISEDFSLGNALKYLSRYKFKGAPLQDLKKARWYIDYLIELHTKKEKNKEAV